MAAPLPESDGDLVRLALEGRQDAYSALYERYFPSVFDFVTRLLRNREEAADVAQDTFIKGMEQLPTLKNPDRFKSWIFTIAHRTGLNRIRSSKRTATVGGSVDDDERATMAVADADPSVNPEQMAAIQEAADIVWEAAAGLDDRTYTVMDLHVRQGLDSAEIAEVMGVSKGNAYTMVSRMKQSFSKTLSTYLLVRKGRQDCETLARVIGEDVDQMTPELRKRADRHVNKCSTCSENRLFYLEPLKVFAALMLVPVPAGLKAAIWGSVAASAVGAAGVGTVAGSAGAGSGSAAGTAGTAAAVGQGASMAAVAAVATLTVAVAAGGWFLTRSSGTPEVVAAPETTTTLFIEIPAVVPPPTTVVAPTTTTTSTTTTTTTTIAEPEPPPTVPPPVTPVPPPPPPPPPVLVVVNDTGSVAEDTTLTVNVLANDTGPVDSGSLRLTAGPANGSAATGTDGTIRYTPALNFVGSDELTYSVADTMGRSGSATVSVSVLPVNDLPVVPGPGAISTTEDTVMSFDPLAGASDVDGDALVMSSFDGVSAAGGILSEGSLVYTPPANFFGADTFSYEVSDGTISIVVTVDVDVAAVADPPAPPAGPAALDVVEDGTGTIDLLAGWSDPDGDTLSVEARTVTTASGGTVVISSNGMATYTPPRDFNGIDTFSFVVTDGLFRIAASATITVQPVNDDPTADDVTFTAPEDAAVGTVLGTVPASDPDGDPVTFTPVAGPIAIDESGTVTIGEALDFTAQQTYTATATVSDGNGGTDVATVTLTVLDINQAPNLDDVVVQMLDDEVPGTVVATLLGTDPDGDVLSYAIDAGDPEGVFSLDAVTGELTFVAAPVVLPFPSSLTVSVTDPDGLSDTATITVVVLDSTGPDITSLATSRARIFAGIAPDVVCPGGQSVTSLSADVADSSGVAAVEFAYTGDIAGNIFSGTLAGAPLTPTSLADFQLFVPASLTWLRADFIITVTATDIFGNSSTFGSVVVNVRSCPDGVS